MSYELVVGTNRIIDCGGVLTSNGKPLIAVAQDRSSGELLVDVEVFGPDGKRIAELRRNSWEYNEGGYSVDAQKHWLALKDRDGQVVLQVQVLRFGIAIIGRAHLYTRRGSLIEVTPQTLVLPGGFNFTGSTIHGSGTAFEIRD